MGPKWGPNGGNNPPKTGSKKLLPVLAPEMLYWGPIGIQMGSNGDQMAANGDQMLCYPRLMYLGCSRSIT